MRSATTYGVPRLDFRGSMLYPMEGLHEPRVTRKPGQAQSRRVGGEPTAYWGIPSTRDWYTRGRSRAWSSTRAGMSWVM